MLLITISNRRYYPEYRNKVYNEDYYDIAYNTHAYLHDIGKHGTAEENHVLATRGIFNANLELRQTRCISLEMTYNEICN